MENQLLSGAETSVLQTGPGLVASDSESRGLWPGSNSGRLLNSMAGRNLNQRPPNAPAPLLLRPFPALHPGLEKGRARPEGRYSEEEKAVVGSWSAGRERGGGSRRAGGRGGARDHVMCVATCRPSCVVEAED